MWARVARAAHFAVADEQEPGLGQDGGDPVNDGDVEPIIRLLPRDHIGRHGQSQRVQGPDHQLDLGQLGIVFALPKLKQAFRALGMVARDGGGVDPNPLGVQFIDPHRVPAQVLLDGLPVFGRAQHAQDNRQPIIGKIGVSDAQTGRFLQGDTGLAYPVPDRHLAMIALGQDVRQPDRGDPTPTQPLLQPMAGDVPIQYLWQAQAYHHLDQQYEVVSSLARDGQFSFHSLMIPGNSTLDPSITRMMRRWEGKRRPWCWPWSPTSS